MKKELADKLYEDFPLTFKNKAGRGRGFEIDDGWEPIVRKAADIIEAHLQWTYASKGTDSPTSLQVKEKFGTLRWYFGEDAFVRGVISMAESWSEETCERCGNPGKPRQGGWIKTLCSSCHGSKEVENFPTES